MKAPAVAAGICCALAAPLCPAVERMTTAPAVAVSPLAGGALLETVLGLLLVLALILGLAWAIRRFGKLPLAGKGMISILGGVSLGPRERAVLLQVGETRLLVGVAPGRVETLYVLEQGSGLPPSFSGHLDEQIRQEAK